MIQQLLSLFGGHQACTQVVDNGSVILARFSNAYKCAIIYSHTCQLAALVFNEPSISYRDSHLHVSVFVRPNIVFVVAVVLNIQFVTATTQHNVWPNENRGIEMGVCVTDRGLKRNLTQLTGRYY